MKNNYWNNKGKYQEQYDNAKFHLLPAYGKAPTIEGEILRAASNLYYDYFNNGFCNNCSGEVNYLLLLNIECSLNITNELLVIKKDAANVCYTENDFSIELESIVDNVMLYIMTKLGNYSDNDKDFDCLSLMDDDYIDYSKMIFDY
jgi:hypothetical protein